MANIDYVAKDDSHIATTCLDYLLLDDFTSGACESEALLKMRLKNFPFLAYAALYWCEHVRSNGEVPSILSRAFEFLRNNAKLSCAYQVLNTSSTTIHEGYVRWPEKLNSGLHLAAYFGLHSIIERYRGDGYGLEITDENGQTPLSWAVDSERIDAIQILMYGRKSSGTQSLDQHQVPIPWAIEKGNRDMVSLLVRFEDQISWRSNDGWTPLLLAVQNEDEVIVKLLIDAGAELDSRDIQGWTPLSLGAASGHERNVKLVLDIHPILADIQDHSGQSALSWAAANGHQAVLKMLLERDDVQPDSRDNSGPIPLSWAAGNGRLEVVRSLLESGKVDPVSRDNDDLTPLSWAAAGDHDSVFELLEQFGADY